jgi:hypothetical protein
MIPIFNDFIALASLLGINALYSRAKRLAPVNKFFGIKEINLQGVTVFRIFEEENHVADGTFAIRI